MGTEMLSFVKKSKVDYEQTAQAYRKYKKRFIFKDLGKGRLRIMYGLRGTGKTTLMFQEYLETSEKKRFYFHANEIKLLNLKLLEVLEAAIYLFGRDLHIFIDEVSRLEGWEEHIKVAYDKYPKLKILLTGSSSLNLLNSKKLLARRAGYIHVPPLSFREYVYLKYGIYLDPFKLREGDVLRSSIQYSIYLGEKLKGKKPLPIFQEYLLTNLPYLFEHDNDTLGDLVEKAIFLDIAEEANFEASTIGKMERLILLLSASNKITYEGISKDLGISKSTVSQMLTYLEKSGIIKKVYPYKQGKSIVRKEWKYYFMVPAIRDYYAQKLVIPDSEIHGNMLEDIVASNLDGIFFSDIDFVYKGLLVEVGSKSKGFSQMKKTKSIMHLKKIIAYEGLDIQEEQGIIKIPLYLFLSII